MRYGVGSPTGRPKQLELWWEMESGRDDIDLNVKDQANVETARHPLNNLYACVNESQLGMPTAQEQ